MWQPFSRARQVLADAQRIDALSMGMEMSVRALKEIKSPTRRAKAMWEATLKFSEQLRE